jgi:hypothetical protein
MKKRTATPRRVGRLKTEAEWDAWEDQLVARLLAARDDEDDSPDAPLPDLPPLGPGDTVAFFLPPRRRQETQRNALPPVHGAKRPAKPRKR